MFGPHLLLEGYNCNNIGALMSQDKIKELLTDLPKLCEMTLIMGPVVHQFTDPETGSEQGVTGISVIAESHIAIHTWPEKACYVLDIYSCKPFDVYKAVGIINHLFQPSKTSIEVIERGADFPRTQKACTIQSEKELIECY